MYLRSLELLGFKSFARKTELVFPRGVAAIVGPNGCGKSNVLDALRWVLGEQSAKALRGAEMSDVIFNGNDRLAPVGMAEVSLTFAECEAELGTAWHEVRVTRRVYRDGKSEYLLNGTGCRLRDIQELFMDTGIGRSAYSVMEQGKVDQILSSRPEDRRAVFEEAAGITKYKTQRREALRKLEATEANLARLSDVLNEVRRQLGSLQRQAAKARRYQALHSDLKRLETHLAYDQWKRLGVDLAACRGELETARRGLSQAEKDLSDDENVLTYRRAALERHDARLEGSRGAFTEARSRLQHAESRLGFNRERLAESQPRLQRFNEDLAAATETLRVVREQLEQTTTQEQTVLARLNEEQELQRTEDTRLRDLRARRLAAEAAVTAAARRAAEITLRADAARAELSRLGAEREAAAARRELLARETETLVPALETAGARIIAARAAFLAAETTLGERRILAADAEAAAADAQRRLTALETAERTANRTLAEKSSRLDALRQLVAEGEGFAAGTRAALRGAGRPDLDKSRILGALGTLMEVAEPRYIPAVEAALGANLQTVLTRDEDAAALILGTLSEKKLGRAALAPAPASSLHSDESQISNLKSQILSVLRPAVPEAAALLGRLLADTFLAENLDAARALQRGQPGSAVATLAGEFLSRDGVWHGGRAGGENAGGSILQRQGQIATLDREVAAARTALAEATKQREATAADTLAAGEAGRAARSAVHAAQGEVSTLAASIGPLERDERGLRARLENCGRELAEFESKLGGIAARNERSQAALDAHAAAVAQADAERTAAAEEAERLRAEDTALADAVNALRVRVAEENQRHAGLAREKGPILARCRELEGFITARRAELEEYQKRLGQSADEAMALQGTISVARTEGEAAGKLVEELVRERGETLTDIERLEAALRARRQGSAGLHERRAAEEVREAQLRLRLENLHERMVTRYQVDLRLFHPDPEAFRAVLRARAEENGGAAGEDPAGIVADLAERLEAIGAVNLDAIAEHDALEERNRFLETQDADLRAAETELRGIIAKINATSRELFIETFEAVRRGFGDIFAELFGGGRADLALADGGTGSNDPLECGIDITARPPGKPQQSLSLLSGGEKTLTAVALLFAIYQVKPSPFCVLDEMDAPLDESNVGRFVKLLDRFAARSQFVVITHNKRTMTRADSLFGVTMEEPGISKLVAVRLTRADGTQANGAQPELPASAAVPTANGAEPHEAATLGT